MKITHWLSLWLKHTVKWTSNSISVWLGKWLPLLISTCLFWSGWQFSLCSPWPKSYIPHCLDSWQMELGCVCVHVVSVCERETDRQNQRRRSERVFKSFSDLLSCSHCMFLFFKKHILVLWMAVSFLLLLLSYKEKHWQFWQDHEARRISRENILMCFVRTFSFCFLIKGLNSISYEAPTNICYLKKNTEWRLSAYQCSP